MMTPLRCVRRGGDQERVSVRVVAEIVQFRGGPLGTKTISNFQANLLFIYSPSCRVVTLDVAAGPPPALV